MKSIFLKAIKNMYKPVITVLHIEDDKAVSEKFARELGKRCIFVHSVGSLEEALEVLKECEVRYIVCDGRFPNTKKGKEPIANFIPLAEKVKRLRQKPQIIGWANSTTVHEYCDRHSLQSFSKIKLGKENFARRNREFIKVERLSATKLADLIEKKIADDIGFTATIKNHKFEHYYSEPGTIMGMLMAADMRTKLFEATAGKNYGPLICHIDNGLLTVFVENSNDKAIAESIYKKILNRGYFPEIQKNIDDLSGKLLKYSRILRLMKYKKISNVGLQKLYINFCALFMNMRMYSSLPTAMEHVTNLWTNLLADILKKKIKDEKERNKVFSTLTAPDRSSYLNLFEDELIKIGISKHQGQNVNIDIDRAWQKYIWINYHFEGVPLTRTNVLSKIKQLGQTKEEFSDLSKKRKEYFSDLQKAKEEIYKKYHFSKKEINLFYIGSEIVYIKYYRKGVFAQSYYSVEFLLEEIGKRIGCTRRQVVNMTADEVLAALHLNIFSGRMLEQRRKDCLTFHKDGHTYVLGGYAESLFRKILEEKSVGSKDIIKGQVAYTGKVKGTVKIVNSPEDMKKFQANDILVSRSTNPSLIFAIKKAAAIITDLGGLTCHAAIVARELKKPCVVGTKFATEVLKDGDIVEVDADKGLVRLIM